MGNQCMSLVKENLYLGKRKIKAGGLNLKK